MYPLTKTLGREGGEIGKQNNRIKTIFYVEKYLLNISFCLGGLSYSLHSANLYS